MSNAKPSFRRLFTLEEANARLPLVRAIATDLSNLARDLVDRRQRLDALSSGRKMSSTDVYRDELAEMEKGIERDARKLEEYVDELQELGVQAKGALEGLIDFPSLMDGRVVYLCWKLGETEVMHWHELDAGFLGRQPLAVSAGAE
jgi:hypothetical protein